MSRIRNTGKNIAKIGPVPTFLPSEEIFSSNALPGLLKESGMRLSQRLRMKKYSCIGIFTPATGALSAKTYK
jgi:hypothetical protein